MKTIQEEIQQLEVENNKELFQLIKYYQEVVLRARIDYLDKISEALNNFNALKTKALEQMANATTVDEIAQIQEFIEEVEYNQEQVKIWLQHTKENK